MKDHLWFPMLYAGTRVHALISIKIMLTESREHAGNEEKSKKASKTGRKYPNLDTFLLLSLHCDIDKTGAPYFVCSQVELMDQFWKNFRKVCSDYLLKHLI